jgi:hypothetical protein
VALKPCQKKYEPPKAESCCLGLVNNYPSLMRRYWQQYLPS